MATAETAGAGSANLQVALSLLSLSLFLLFASPIVSAASTHAISELYLGRSVDIRAAFRVGFKLFFKLVGTSFLMMLIVILGLLLLILPGLYLAFAYMLVYQVVVIEGRSGMRALNRSRELAKQNLLRILGIYVVALLLSLVLSSVVGLVLGGIPVVGVVANGIVQAVFTAYWSACFVLLYFDIRCRKEAFDLEHLANVVEGQTPAPTPVP